MYTKHATLTDAYRLKHLEHLGFHPNVILDVGAAHGDWARMSAKIWPEAKIYGIEPNLSEKDDLERTKRDLPHFNYLHGFLGSQAGAVKYSNQGTQTTLCSETTDNPNDSQDQAQIYVLDALIKQGKVETPDLIKLDVQGYELEVLRGAVNALTTCQMVLAEVNFFAWHKKVPTVTQVIQFMAEHGFCWYDIAGVIRRPTDDALWQMDLIFVRQDHPLRSTTPWTS